MATTDEIIGKTAPSQLVDHNLVDRDVESLCGGMVRYEKRPAKRRDGSTAEGLVNAWIVINNPKQYNSYTTDMVKALILAFRRASVDRGVNAVVFTGTGDKAFCTGGTRRSTRSITPATRRSTGSTCACSTTWSRPSSAATSRWSAG